MTDLERFREALERQRSRLLEASRDSRYKPPTDLASASLALAGDGASAAEMVAEILDLSGDGMKVAIAAGPPVRVGQTCSLLFEPDSGESFALLGEVRWVESSAFITVFGIALLQATCSPHV